MLDTSKQVKVLNKTKHHLSLALPDFGPTVVFLSEEVCMHGQIYIKYRPKQHELDHTNPTKSQTTLI